MLGVIDFSVAFDCWKEWCEFFGPITERIKAKPSISDYFRRTIEICSLVIGDGRNLSVHLIQFNTLYAYQLCFPSTYQFHNEPPEYRYVLNTFNTVFTFMFTGEAILKLFAFRTVSGVLVFPRTLYLS